MKLRPSSLAGSVATSGAVTSIDGKSIDQLLSDGVIGGGVGVGVVVRVPTRSEPVATDVAVPEGAMPVTWASWLRGIAVAADAPAWSPALKPAPGCVLASYTAGTTMVTVTGDTFVDARQSGTGCGSVSLQGLTIDLQGDLTIVADGIRSTNGLVVTASDGGVHHLRLITPGSVGETVASGGITLLGGTDIDPAVAVSLQTPGTLQVNGSAHLSGQVIAGRVISTGTVAVNSSIPRQPL